MNLCFSMIIWIHYRTNSVAFVMNLLLGFTLGLSHVRDVNLSLGEPATISQ